MKRSKWVIILINLGILLAYFNYSIFSKEGLLNNGKLVLLKLAPVDPRSLMQGDYMELRYEISGGIDAEKLPKRGFCVVRVNDSGIARRVRLQAGKQPLQAGEYLIRYNAPDAWNIHIGAESYFFQEGHSDKYAKAQFAGIRVDGRGNSLLEGLYDERMRKIN